MKTFCMHCAALAVLALAVAAVGQTPIFSLDDNPAMPLTSPPGPIYPGFGAEDPFGLGLIGGPLAPSPSLPMVMPNGAMDADLLAPTGTGVPRVEVGMSQRYGQVLGYLNAASDNSERGNNKVPTLHLGFSVDRVTQGAPGTALANQASLNQQPGDTFRTDALFVHPQTFAPQVPAVFGYNGVLPSLATPSMNNFQIHDESQLDLLAGNPMPVGPNVPCPPAMPGTHDNVDALNWQALDPNGDMNTDRPLFYSVAPDEAGITGQACCDIMYVPANAPAAAAVQYAGANKTGLLNFMPGEIDDIDALVVWESPLGQPGVADPQLDYALFSLAPGSATLQFTPGLTAGDVFFTNFTGAFWTYASWQNLGLLGDPTANHQDNVDALEVLAPGDADLSGTVSLADLSILAGSYGGPGGWLQGDFTGDGLINLADLSILAGNYGQTETPVPEPAVTLLLAAGAMALLRKRRT